MNIWQNSKKFPASCPNIINFYSNGMDDVVIIDKKAAAYRLVGKAKIASTWACFWYHWCRTCKQCHIVYMKLGDDLSLLNFKIAVARALIGIYSHHNRLFSSTRPNKRKSHKPFLTREVLTCIPEFRRSESDVIIARAKAQISNLLCPVRHVACYAWRRQKSFFETSLVVLQFHGLLYTFKIHYSCVDCSDSYCFFYFYVF